MGEFVGQGALGRGNKGMGRRGDRGTEGLWDKEMGGKGEEWFVLESEVKLHNGDGICFFDKNDELQGMYVNRVEGNKIFVRDLKGLYDGADIYRNYDHEFNKNIKNENAVRQIPVKFYISFPDGKVLLTARDLDGNRATELLDECADPAANQDKMIDVIHKQLSKTGDTMFFTDEIKITEKPVLFIPIGKLNELRRNVLLSLEEERIRNYRRWGSSVIKNDVPYPADSLDYRGNVVNKLSRAFYERHGVKKIENGFELGHEYDGKVIMTCRYCSKNELGVCARMGGVGTRGLGDKGMGDRGNKGKGGRGDMGKGGEWFIRDKKRRYKLVFDCKNCEMSVIYLNEG
jgi:putative protease